MQIYTAVLRLDRRLRKHFFDIIITDITTLAKQKSSMEIDNVRNGSLRSLS